jgi:4-hydroxyphenylpyruvate dioxygenase
MLSSGCPTGSPLPPPILAIDHLEFFVGNAKQAAYYYSYCFGFSPTAYRGLETGDRKTTAYVIEQGQIRFVISAALAADHPIAHSVATHGDTIAVVALAVPDVALAYNYALKRGATGAMPPTQQTDAQGEWRVAAIQGFGDMVIKFVDRSGYSGAFAPGFVAYGPPRAPRQGLGLSHIDHVVGNVERGALERWSRVFREALGFDLRMQFDDQTIATADSALASQVMQTPSQVIVNINEPADGRRRSQIDEFLDFHRGPGIQHIGLATADLVTTVTRLRAAGVEFLPIPPTYYEDLAPWVQALGVPVETLAELGILVDRDGDGYLLQLFTKPVGDRPTLFFEIIERRGCRGFGAGNFKHLFIALEREQARRGNL